MSSVRPGQLLLATPDLLDPNFADSVVLLLDVDADGVLGVVLNHPTPIRVDEVLQSWGEVVCTPDVLFSGGPVGADGALAVGRLSDPADLPIGWRSVFADVGIVDLDTPVELLDGGFGDVRIFAGYAGWGAGQLDDEIAEGAWYVVGAEAGDIFGAETDDLLRRVLRRQPGDLAWHSTRPSDPQLN